ncbi:CopG family transcriptional regulator [Alteromonas sp. CYL-A6]|uniref:ribbon-helix-helix domain-containing protein n=1 Tax=Alteromonas nitratireducens TaxID=3390813 RepID=UPI0034B1C359
MSLLSLRKSTPSVSARRVSVDTFIDDALRYATGQTQRPPCTQSAIGQALPAREHHCADATSAMRRATFTLSDDTIRALTSLSEQTGISRSRLIRIWVSEQQGRDCENLLHASVP